MQSRCLHRVLTVIPLAMYVDMTRRRARLTGVRIYPADSVYHFAFVITSGQVVKFCTIQINSPRGLLTEYGEAMSVGRVALEKVVVGILERLARRRPALPQRATRSLATALRVRVPSSVETLVRKLEEHTTFRDSFSTFCSLPSTISRASFSSGSQTASAAVASTRRVSREPTQFLLTLIVDRSDENQTTLGQSVLPPYTSLLANHPVPLGFRQ